MWAIPSTSLIIANNNNNGSDSGVNGDTSVVLQGASEINPAANVTLLGGGQFNLNSFAQTVNNLTITNDGGTNGANGPAVLTGSGMLTVAGTVPATAASGVNASYFDIPTINGELKFSNANATIYEIPPRFPTRSAWNSIPRLRLQPRLLH